MAASPTVDLSKLRITPIPSKECVRQFRCGVRQIDDWVSDKAFKFHDKGRARVFCAFEDGGITPLGVCCLSFSPVQSKLLFGQDGDFYKAGHGAPFVYIDYLAVQRMKQSGGVGTILLMDALRRAHLVSQHIPVYGVALRSLNSTTTSYYEKFGFVLRETDQPNPIMILPIWSVNDLFNRRA